MTTPSYASLPSYLSLVAESKLISQKWGDALVIGFRGDYDQITKAYRLFETFDPRPKVFDEQTGDPLDFPSPPRLNHLFEKLAYIYLPSQQRLIDTLSLYFRVQFTKDLGRLVDQDDAREVGVNETQEPTNETDDQYLDRAFRERAEFAAQLDTIEVPMIEGAEWVVDEELVTQLAAQATEAFIRDHIEICCFVPAAPQPLIAEHSLGREDRREYDKVENLADSAIHA